MINKVVLIGSDGLGSGDPVLGRILLGNLLRILGEKDLPPEFIVLWNAGVKAAVAGSESVDHLKRLEGLGVQIVSCKTCVEFFELEGEIAVGQVDGMSRILDILGSGPVLTV